jgi:hypothetical protein
VVRNLDLTSPRGILFGWLAAAFGFTSGLLLAVGGQGLGAFVGGCGWIGISTPLGRQVWALVNQPALNFASEPRAAGYWFGSLVLPLLAGVAVLHLIPRARTLAAELIAVHLAWGAAVVGVAWLPLLDPVDGHLARFLELTDVPSLLVWAAPSLAAIAAFPPVLRLLSLARVARPHTGRGLRLMVVAAHLAAPCVAWTLLVSAVRGAPPLAPIVALLAPLLVACAVAWFGYPPAYVHRLREIEAASWLRLLCSVLVVVALVWVAGRPLGEDTWAGLLWGEPSDKNNIRPWVATDEAWPPWAASR